MKILLLQTWITNVGNGFIDKGAYQLLRESFPEAEIIETSGYPLKSASRRDQSLFPELIQSKISTVKNYLGSKSSSHLDRTVHVSDFVDADIAVLPGCVLYDNVFHFYRETLNSLRERGIPLILLGAGGGDYSRSTQKYVKDIFSEIEPAGMITRDSDAYDAYQNSMSSVYNGIDCAFFINDWYDPPKTEKTFSTLTFDKIDEPTRVNDYDAVRTDHYPFGQPHAHIGQKFKKYKMQYDFYKKDNIFISDTLKDYLFFYANARITHSDRIHACVPTLAYGNKAKFWIETPRAALFKRVLNSSSVDGKMTVDRDYLRNLKRDQKQYLKEIVSEVL